MNKKIITGLLLSLLASTALADRQSTNITITNSPFNGGAVGTVVSAPGFTSTIGDLLLKPTSCGSGKILTDSSGTYLNVASPHGCTSVVFTGAIAGINLVTVGGPSLVFGQTITGAGIAANTHINGGSGDAWTVDISQTVASESMTASATAKNNLILRSANAGETYYQFAVSDSTPEDHETGTLIQSNVNGFQLRAISGGGIHTQLFNGASSGLITWPAGTTNFQSTGGTHNFVSQASTGAPFTVVQPSTSDLSDIGSFNLNTTGTVLIGSSGAVSIFSVGNPTVTSDASHNLHISSGLGNGVDIGDTVFTVGSSQANKFTFITSSGDPIFSSNAGNMVISTGSGTKIVLKNGSGNGLEIFPGSGNDIRLTAGTNPQIGSSAGDINIQSASGVVRVNTTLRYGSFTASGTCTILGTFSMQDSGGTTRTIPYCS